MSSAEGSHQPKLLRRVSTPIFLIISLLLVPATAFVSLILGGILCVIAGIENSDLQTRICPAALLIGFVGSIYLIIRARRSPVLRQQQAQIATNAPPPLPIVPAVHDDIRRNDEPTEADGHETAAEPESEDTDDDAGQIPMESGRIIDWVKVFTTPVLVTFNVALVAIALVELSKQTSNNPMLAQAMYVTGFVGLLLVPIAFLSGLISHVMGTHFDVARDRLSYPYYAWRLRLPLSGIHDANAQTISKRGVDFLASLGEKTPKRKTVHHYHVNLSGDFGARRLMFRSKFKRDQFLSILRTIRPDVRVTRWS